jgi:GNAT superfamily N-acetyltransferase
MKIDRLICLLLEDLKPLVCESEKDGFRFLRRLVDEWEDGRNRFDKINEGFFALWKDGDLVAVGGLNCDPFSNDPRTGRLRRFYVSRVERRKGYGRLLVQRILDEASTSFDVIVLNTDSAVAGEFYERLGFAPLPDDLHSSHRIRLERRWTGLNENHFFYGADS